MQEIDEIYIPLINKNNNETIFHAMKNLCAYLICETFVYRSN